VARLSELAEAADTSLLMNMLVEFSRLDTELKYATSPRLVLETASLKTARLKADDCVALAARVAALEQAIENGVVVKGEVISDKGEVKDNIKSYADIANTDTPKAKPQAVSVPLEPIADTDMLSLPVQKISQAVSEVLQEDAKSVWGRLITYFRKKQIMHLYTLLSDFTDYKLHGRELVILADDDYYLRFCDDNTQELIKTALLEIDAPFSLKVEKVKGSVDMDKEIVRLEKLAGFKPKIVK